MGPTGGLKLRVAGQADFLKISEAEAVGGQAL